MGHAWKAVPDLRTCHYPTLHFDFLLAVGRWHFRVTLAVSSVPSFRRFPHSSRISVPPPRRRGFGSFSSLVGAKKRVRSGNCGRWERRRALQVCLSPSLDRCCGRSSRGSHPVVLCGRAERGFMVTCMIGQMCPSPGVPPSPLLPPGYVPLFQAAFKGASHCHVMMPSFVALCRLMSLPGREMGGPHVGAKRQTTKPFLRLLCFW